MLISKLGAANKENYNYENILGIRYCKGLKHHKTRAASHSHMRAKT